MGEVAVARLTVNRNVTPRTSVTQRDSRRLLAGVTVASELLMVLGGLACVPKQLLDVRTIWNALRITTAGVATAIVGGSLLPVSLFVYSLSDEVNRRPIPSA